MGEDILRRGSKILISHQIWPLCKAKCLLFIDLLVSLNFWHTEGGGKKKGKKGNIWSSIFIDVPAILFTSQQFKNCLKDELVELVETINTFL